MCGGIGLYEFGVVVWVEMRVVGIMGVRRFVGVWWVCVVVGFVVWVVVGESMGIGRVYGVVVLMGVGVVGGLKKGRVYNVGVVE